MAATALVSEADRERIWPDLRELLGMSPAQCLGPPDERIRGAMWRLADNLRQLCESCRIAPPDWYQQKYAPWL